MRKTILAGILGLLTLNNAVAETGDADAGKAKSAMCAACHGADGNSMVPMYPSLAGQSATYIAKQLADFKLGMSSGGESGRVDPVMGGMTMALTPQDMADLGAFFAGQVPKPGNGEGNAIGKKLYLGGDAERGITACIACHGINGSGMDKAGFPTLKGQSKAYITVQLEKFRDGARNNDANNMMKNVAIKLELEDIKALAEYLSAIR